MSNAFEAAKPVDNIAAQSATPRIFWGVSLFALWAVFGLLIYGGEDQQYPGCPSNIGLLVFFVSNGIYAFSLLVGLVTSAIARKYRYLFVILFSFFLHMCSVWMLF